MFVCIMDRCHVLIRSITEKFFWQVEELILDLLKLYGNAHGMPCRRKHNKKTTTKNACFMVLII